MVFPLAVLSVLRLIKHLAAMALMAGVVGAFLPRSLEDRQRAAYFVAGPAWGVVVATGFLLTWVRGISLLSGWVLASLVLAIVDLQFVLFAVGTEGRRTPSLAALAIGTLALIVALMIYQPG
jgi:hypothetical protein